MSLAKWVELLDCCDKLKMDRLKPQENTKTDGGNAKREHDAASSLPAVAPSLPKKNSNRLL